MDTPPKRPRGRPKGTTKPDDQKFTERLDVPVNSSQKQKVKNRGGLDWVRSLIDNS